MYSSLGLHSAMVPLNSEDPTNCINQTTADLLLLKIHTQKKTLYRQICEVVTQRRYTAALTSNP